MVKFDLTEYLSVLTIITASRRISVEVLGLRVNLGKARGACHNASTAWRIEEPLLKAEDASRTDTDIFEGHQRFDRLRPI